MKVEKQHEKIRLCPGCGSPAVEFSALEGGVAECRVCKWKGSRDELLLMPFDHIYGTDEGVGMALHNEIRRVFTNPLFATDIIRFLARWGFVPVDKDNKADVKLTTRYIAAIGRAVLVAVIKEREKIEMEKGNGGG